MMRFVTVALASALAVGACAEGSVEYRPTAATAPSTDIYLGTSQLNDERLAIGDLVNITQRDGYDNQPYFTDDGAGLLFTSARDTLQTDIYRYDIASGTITQVTNTPTASEYSPTVMPGGTEFSVIHEDSAGQYLWRFGLNGSDHGRLLEDVAPVGYQAWGDSNTVALFVLGDSVTPATLQLVDVASGEASIVAENIGRSLHRVPRKRAISFVHKETEDDWYIKAVDLESRSISTIVSTLPGSEDYAWLPDGSIIMGNETTLYRWAGGDGWAAVADLSAFGVRNITRLAVSAGADRIAVVGDRKE